MSMEIILTPATVEITQGIKNKDYLKKELASQLEYYKGLAVTEETMKDAKSDRATLNKLRTAIDDQRKAVKKQFEGLYKPFETDCRELIAMIDEPIAAIDSQMQVLNDKKKAEKRGELEKYFELLQPPAFVKLDDVLDPKWSNATAKLDKLKADLADKVQRIADDSAEVRRLYSGSPMLTAIMERFEHTRDKGAALAYAAELERKEQQRKEREAAEKARLEAERQAQVQSEPYIIEKSSAAPADAVVKTVEQPEVKGRVTFTVVGTKAQIIAVREFMKANGITFNTLRQ